MEQKLTLREIDCSPSKDGGLTVSLHLRPTGEAEAANETGRRRRRRRRKMTSEQMLELARSAINEAMETDQGGDASKRVLLGAAGSQGGERTPRRLHWPG